MKRKSPLPLAGLLAMLCIGGVAGGLWLRGHGYLKLSRWQTDATLIAKYKASRNLRADDMTELIRRLENHSFNASAQAAFDDANIFWGMRDYRLTRYTFDDLMQGRLTATQVAAIFAMPIPTLPVRLPASANGILAATYPTGYYQERWSLDSDATLDQTELKFERSRSELEIAVAAMPKGTTMLTLIACDIGGVAIDLSAVHLGGAWSADPVPPLARFDVATMDVPIATLPPQRPLALSVAATLTISCVVDGQTISKTLPVGISENLLVWDAEQTKLAAALGPDHMPTAALLEDGDSRLLGFVDHWQSSFDYNAVCRRGDQLLDLGKINDAGFGPRWVKIPSDCDLQPGDVIEMRDIKPTGSSTLIASWPLEILKR